MAAGIVDHTGTRDLAGCPACKAMPITATLAMVAAASMAGVLLLNGFISKEMFCRDHLRRGDWTHARRLPLAATVAGAFSVASLRFILQCSSGRRPTDLPRVRPVQGHADHGHAGHGGGRVHGGRAAAAQRLHLERDVLRRDHLRQRRLDHARRLPLAATVAGAFSVASLRFILQCSSGRRPTDLPRGAWSP